MANLPAPTGTCIRAYRQYLIVNDLPEITNETRYTYAYPIIYSCQLYLGNENVNYVFSRYRARELCISQ